MECEVCGETVARAFDMHTHRQYCVPFKHGHVFRCPTCRIRLVLQDNGCCKCPRCDLVKSLNIPVNMGQFYGAGGRKSKPYTARSHFWDTLACILGLGTPKVDLQVDLANLTKSQQVMKMRAALKEMKRPDLYKFVPGLIWSSVGLKRPPVSREILNCAEKLFLKFERSGERVYYPFLIYKILSSLIPNHFVLGYIYLQGPTPQRKNSSKIFDVLAI